MKKFAKPWDRGLGWHSSTAWWLRLSSGNPWVACGLQHLHGSIVMLLHLHGQVPLTHGHTLIPVATCECAGLQEASGPRCNSGEWVPSQPHRHRGLSAGTSYTVLPLPSGHVSPLQSSLLLAIPGCLMGPPSQHTG